MPAYLFCEDVLYPFIQKTSDQKKPRTQEAEAWISRTLTEFFKGWWVTDRRTELKKVIVGETVTAYRAKRKADGVSPNSVKRELAVASASCNYAISEFNYEITNPFARRLISSRDQLAIKPQKQPRSEGVVKKIFMASDGVLQDILIFAANTGFRQSEILALRWDQIRGDVVVFEPRDQKNNRHGKRPLGPEALAVLARRPDSAELVFTLDGQKIPRRTLHTLYDDARTRAEHPEVLFKDFRDSFATWFLEGGGSWEALKNLMGHVDIRTTQDAYGEDPVDPVKAALKKMRGVGC